MFLLIGAQQNVYLAFSGNFICSIMLAKNLKSSIRHRVYKLEGEKQKIYQTILYPVLTTSDGQSHPPIYFYQFYQIKTDDAIFE